MAGAFQALSNVVGVTNPIFISVANLIIPASGRARSERGPKAAFHEAVRYGAQGAFFVLPYLILVLIWPHQVLSILYGRHSDYANLTTALRIFSAAQFVYYVAVVLATLLNALGHTRTTFFVLVVSALVTIGLGIPFVIWKGLLGAVVTMSLGILVRAVLLWFAAQRQILEFQVDRVESQEIAQSLP
jgi:O-antigen/teichoic acid export membrane protein